MFLITDDLCVQLTVMRKNPTLVATLNAQENHAWEFAFNFHLQDGHSDLKADKLAWEDLTIEFPRLKRFKGCR